MKLKGSVLWSETRLGQKKFWIVARRALLSAIESAAIIHLVALLTKVSIRRNNLHHMKRLNFCLGVVLLDPESA
jgi:hypothetical protein